MTERVHFVWCGVAVTIARVSIFIGSLRQNISGSRSGDLVARIVIVTDGVGNFGIDKIQILF